MLTEKQVRFRSEGAGRFSMTGMACTVLPLRTDSVNRGSCISLLTLAIVVLAASFDFFLFFVIEEY